MSYNGNILSNFSKTLSPPPVQSTVAIYGNYSGQFMGGFGYDNPDPYVTTTPYEGAPTYFLSIPYSNDFNLSATDFTMSADFNANQFETALTGMYILSKDRYGSTFDWNLTIQNNQTLVFYSNGTASQLIANVPPMNTGTWYNIKVQYIAGVVSLYLDNVLYASTSFTISNDTLSYVTVGSSSFNNPGGFFNGYIDNVKIYNNSLAAYVLDLDFENLSSDYLYFTDNTGKIATIHPPPSDNIFLSRTSSIFNVISINIDIVRSNLLFHIDSVNYGSYPRTGIQCYDLMNNSRVITLNNGVGYNTEGAFTFNGSQDINVSNDGTMTPQNISIETWVKAADITTNTYYNVYRVQDGIDGGLPVHMIAFQDNGTILTFGTYSNFAYSELDTNINSTDYVNKWVQIICTFGGGFKRLYVNGNLINASIDTGTLYDRPNAGIFIGCSEGTTEYYKGDLSIVRMYDRPLSGTEVLQNYHTNKSNFIN